MITLIVNADDFGLTRGVTRGIIEAHQNGIVTSTSLMVDRPDARNAARDAESSPRLAVGLHAEVPPDEESSLDARRELLRQLADFERLMGRPPTHLDSHWNTHRRPDLRDLFVAMAAELSVPLRFEEPINNIGNFYGAWDGESHPEHITVESFLTIFDANVREGLNELACHPGYASDDLDPAYCAEREVELTTLCDPALAFALRQRDVVLRSFADVKFDGTWRH